MAEPTSTTPPPVTYANAEVRGRLRQWKASLARQYLVFDRAYRSGKWQPIVTDFIKRSADQGRRRAFGKLVKLFGPAAVLEGLRLDGRMPLGVWSMLKPREGVTVDAAPESGLAQDCVTVNYLLAGAWPAYPEGLMGGVTEGLWTLEVPDHALGRAVERSGMLPETIIRDAHHNSLRLRAQQVAPAGAPRPFLLRAGAGGFACELDAYSDVSLGGALGFHVLARTWIDDDRLHDDQAVLADDGLPGERLGDSYLLPAALRRLKRTAAGVTCESAGEAMPDLLSLPQGRA